MDQKQTNIPDTTAIRTALWRDMHVLIDDKPHVLEDTIGLKLAAPDAHWRVRGVSRKPNIYR